MALESLVVVSERRCAGLPSAGILTPVMVTGGGLGDGSSFHPRKGQIEGNIVKVGVG